MTARLLAAGLAASAPVIGSGCGDEGKVAASLPDGVTVLEHVQEEALSGIATGVFSEHAAVWGEVPVDPRYTHALSFQATPMMPPLLRAEPTSGPVILYSDEGDALVVSAMDRFFGSLLSFDGGVLRWGLHGEVDEVPAGFRHRLVLVEGKGINATVAKWGEFLRADRGRAPVPLDADLGVSHLGYWTDNGAAYYYATEPGMNAEETLLAVRDEADAIGLPLRYFQLDSWWYFKAESDGLASPGGLLEWAPMPEHFPDGLESFRERLGLPLVAHNRWFDLDNAYRDLFEFVEGPKMALPVGRAVFDLLMDAAVSWGVFTYEQDWLVPQWEGVPWVRASPDRGEAWIGAIDEAARDHGLTVQLTMAGPPHVLDALDRPSVTSVRTSIDYKASLSKESYWPQFHTVNLVAAALGIPPFKDTFQSSEHHGLAEALISTLSAGPVGPSDPLGAADRAVLDPTCLAEGLLVRPDRPATPIDAMFLPHARPFTVATSTDHGPAGRWYYVAAFHLASAHPQRTDLDRFWSAVSYDGEPVSDHFHFPEVVTDWSFHPDRDLAQTEPPPVAFDRPYVAYDWRAGTVLGAVDPSSSFDLPEAPDLYDFAYLVFVPVQPNGLALVGSPDHFATAARQLLPAPPAAAGPDALAVTVTTTPGSPDTPLRLRAWDTVESRFLDVEVSASPGSSVEVVVSR